MKTNWLEDILITGFAIFIGMLVFCIVVGLFERVMLK